MKNNKLTTFSIRNISCLKVLLLFICVFLTNILFGQVIKEQPDFYNPSGTVYALFDDGEYTYVGGDFDLIEVNQTYFGSVSKTNGFSIKNSQNGSLPLFSQAVYSVVEDGSGGYYVGGNFTSVNGITRNRLAHFDSNGELTDWNPNANSVVNVLKKDGDYIYVGGRFTTIGGVSRTAMVKVDLQGNVVTAWNANISASGTADVGLIEINADDIYVSGTFNTIGGNSLNNFAKLNKTNGNSTITWNPNTDGAVSSMIIEGDEIYIGGLFFYVGGSLRIGLAKINKSDGSLVTDWVCHANSIVFKIHIEVDHLYVGGMFNNIGGIDITRFARINKTTAAVDQSWDAQISGDPGWNIKDFIIDGDDIYIAGGFNSVGGVKKANLALIDKNTAGVKSWNVSTNQNVSFMFLNENEIYIGGMFDRLGLVVENLFRYKNIDRSIDANWNPTTENIIRTIGVSGNGVYIGGDFISANGQNRSRLAKFNRTTGELDELWNPNANLSVEALIADGSSIYVGGAFSPTGGTPNNIGGQPRSYLAKLNNTDGSADPSWIANASNNVQTLLIEGDDLYVGGGFSTIGGVSKSCLAKLNKNTAVVDDMWNPNIDYTSGTKYVYALDTDENYLYIGGFFDKVGGIAGTTRNNIARVNKSTAVLCNDWDPNASWAVSAVVAATNSVYIGGQFTTVGGLSKEYLAKLNLTDGSPVSTWTRNLATSVRSLLINDYLNVGGNFLFVNGGAFYRNFTSIELETVASSLTKNPNEDVVLEGTNVSATISGGSGGNLIDETEYRYNNGSTWSVWAEYNIGSQINSNEKTEVQIRTRRLSNSSTQNSLYNSISWTIEPLPTPTISANPDSLDFGNTTVGEYNQMQYTLTATNLTSNVTVIAPSRYEVSLNISSGYTSILDISEIAGSIDTIIYVRFYPNAESVFSGIISNSSAGADTVNINVNGEGVISVFINGFSNPENIKIYPNPVSSELIIEVKDNNKLLNFEIINATGQVVFESSFIDKTIVTTTDFADGVYFIRFENGGNFQFKKMIKK